MQGMRTVGPHVAAKLCDIVKLRNKLARSLGYEDFYDYKVVFLSCSFQPSSKQTSWQLACSFATLHWPSIKDCAVLSHTT